MFMGSEGIPSGARQERGAGTLGVLVICAGLLLTGYAGYKVGPSLFSHYQLKDAVQRIVQYGSSGVLSQTRFAASPSADSSQDIREAILNSAREMRIPLQPKNVQVNEIEGRIIVRVGYAVPIEFPGGVYQLQLGMVEAN